MTLTSSRGREPPRSPPDFVNQLQGLTRSWRGGGGASRAGRGGRGNTAGESGSPRPARLAVAEAGGNASVLQNKAEKREACAVCGALTSAVGPSGPGVSAPLGGDGERPGELPALRVQRPPGASDHRGRGPAEPRAGDPGPAVPAGAEQLPHLPQVCG